jgi:hypothetical protein
LQREYVAKEVVDKSLSRLDNQITALDHRREQGEKEIFDLLHREIAGVKEFISDRISESRENSTGRLSELSGKFDALATSFQGLSNDLFRAVGRLEGRVERANNLSGPAGATAASS